MLLKDNLKKKMKIAINLTNYGARIAKKKIDPKIKKARETSAVALEEFSNFLKEVKLEQVTEEKEEEKDLCLSPDTFLGNNNEPRQEKKEIVYKQTKNEKIIKNKYKKFQEKKGNVL
jgi:NCAIR mutase (PurE)-related protein